MLKNEVFGQPEGGYVMTDSMEMFYQLYQYIVTGIQIFFGFYFFVRFLHKKMKIYFYFLFGGCAVCVICFIPGAAIVKLAVFILLLAAAGIFACHTDWRTAALYAVLVEEIMQLGYGIVKSLLSILYPHLSAFEQNLVGFVFMLGGEAASLLLTGLCYGVAIRYFSDEMHSFHYGIIKKEYMFLVFIPILMIFIMNEYINSFIYGMVVMNVDGTESYLYTNHYQMLIIQLLGMGSLFCILFAYKKLLQNFRLSTEISLLEQEEHSLNRYVEEAKARYDETKSFRHDIRNHIAVVKNLLQSGKLEEAVSYIEDMNDIAEKMSLPCSTNNPVVDILVGNKLGIAKNMGIDVDCSLFLPYPCDLKDIDICIVLSNALDNAIRACKNMDNGTPAAPAGACIMGCPNGYIHVSGRIQGDFLMIEVENSFHEKNTFKKGTGLSNVKKAAEKYGGAMSIETRGDVFILQVLLIIPQHPESISQQMG